MLRSNPAASMQKTYDEVYLVCSTAIYFEKQNNEEEALRSWREALDQIYYHNAYKIPANYRAKTETEKALQDSLRDMELQCKERVDLFDALRKSRMEKSKNDDLGTPTNGNNMPHPALRRQSGGSIRSQNGALGDGTVAPSSYSSLARPPPLQAHSSRSLRSAEAARPLSSTPSLQPSSAMLQPPTKRTSRSPSPEKRSVFKSTLRGEKKDANRPSGSRLAATLRSRPPQSAAQAATLAWPGGIPPGIGSGPTNSSSTSLNVPSTAASRKGSMETQPDSVSRHGSDRISSNAQVRADSPTTPSLLHQTRSAPNTQQSSRTYETTITRPTFPREDLDKTGASRPLRQAPPPPPPHRSRPRPSPEIPNGNLAEGNGELAPPIPPAFPSYRKEYPKPTPIDPRKVQSMSRNPPKDPNKDLEAIAAAKPRSPRPAVPRKALPSSPPPLKNHRPDSSTDHSSASDVDHRPRRRPKKEEEEPLVAELAGVDLETKESANAAWDARVQHLMKNLPKGVDEQAAKAIFNEVVIKGDEVHWDDVAGLDVAKNALKEAVVYPFLRPDLFMGLREPARGMLLFGPPGTGKTMLARAVATESHSTFFAISASSLTSKFLGESEKLVRALFALAKALTPSIIFVDEIDSLLSARAGSGEHEASRRIKTEFLIAWSDLAKAAAGREQADGDASRVLVLAATNLPWAIDEAARRRFVRRQYIPLPEDHVRGNQLRKLMSAQKHDLKDADIAQLIVLTDGFSGSDITALAKDAAMGPLRSLGEQLLHMSPDEIRPINFDDFKASLVNIRPSVSKQGLKEFEDWATQFGERGG